MKRLMAYFILFLCVVTGVFADTDYEVYDSDPLYFAIRRSTDDLWYIFTKDGAGLVAVASDSAGQPSDQLIYDFGSRPAWFMLVYLEQTDGPVQDESIPRYYYKEFKNIKY